MKPKSYSHLFLASILTMSLLTACEKDEATISHIKSFASLPEEDGFIINSPTRIVHDYYVGSQGKSLNTGWNASGYSMRSFISFDVSDIMPPADKKLMIDEAILKVYEANTNMHPFDGEGIRAVNCYLLDYGALDLSDYDLAPFADCGTISTWGYNVLKEYPLKVTSFLKNFHQTNPAKTKFQFRLQFVPDGNVIPPSPLTSGMWNVFSGDETQKVDYRPTLMIKYHYANQ